MLQERSVGRIGDHDGSNYIELLAILAVGAGHVATEIHERKTHRILGRMLEMKSTD